MTDEFRDALHRDLTAILQRHIEPIFKKGSKVTLLVRQPWDDEADVLVTSDDLFEVDRAIVRAMVRSTEGA